ncbi:ABC transporter G family member 20 isoform X2 [Vespula squamosa]|uniref:ABC transporter G family member 20 isoform X2 n=1 Tax=Vespula squamosa TaxID=30214 RepID=A0ABD2AIA8_VESSQ
MLFYGSKYFNELNIRCGFASKLKISNYIGLMRSGKLLAESTPSQLLDQFQCDNLEDAFLELSKHQNENRNVSEINRNENDNSETLHEMEFMEASINLSTRPPNASTKTIKNLCINVVFISARYFFCLKYDTSSCGLCVLFSKSTREMRKGDT